MPTTDPISILLDHDRWATHTLLDACAPLSHEQLHHPFDIGPGSLHATIVHNIGAIISWADLLARRPARPWIDQSPRPVPALRDEFDLAAADFAALAHSGPLDETFVRTRPDGSFTFTRSVIVLHVATHGVHHRAQCVNMLRRLGVTPLPKYSVTGWSIDANPAAHTPTTTPRP